MYLVVDLKNFNKGGRIRQNKKSWNKCAVRSKIKTYYVTIIPQKTLQLHKKISEVSQKDDQ